MSGRISSVTESLNDYETALHEYEKLVNPESEITTNKLEQAQDKEAILEIVEKLVEEINEVKDKCSNVKADAFTYLLRKVDGFKRITNNGINFECLQTYELLENIDVLLSSHVSMEASIIDTIEMVTSALDSEYDISQKHIDEYNDIEDMYSYDLKWNKKSRLYEIDPKSPEEIKASYANMFGVKLDNEGKIDSGLGVINKLVKEDELDELETDK